MTKLKSLTLSNLRRFGDNTKIKFGEKATIIIAPNGTGKTSIFEAIELVLTEKVSRLNELSTLVRDKQAQANVALEFSCLTKKSVKITNDGKTKFLGDLNSILNTDDFEGLPYLLRLTHMLDQRGSDWFVQSSTAGEQLNKLPIGRDAFSVNKLITSVKRSSNSYSKDKNRDLIEAQDQEDKFKDLITQKVAIETDSNRPLVPIESLIFQLQEIAKNLNHDCLFTGDNIEGVKDNTIKLRANAELKLQDSADRKSKLLEMRTLVESYPDSVSKLKSAMEENEKHKKSLQINKENLESKQLEEASKNAIYKKKFEELNVLKTVMDRIISHDRLIDNVGFTNKNLIAISFELEKCEREESELRIKYLAQCDIQSKLANNDKNLDLFKREEDLASRAKINLETVREFYALQIENQNILKTAEISRLESIEKTQLQFELKNKAKSELEREELHLSQLTKTTDAIRSAVGIISSNLPANQNDCPVCGESHGVVELRKRINIELDKIDPSIALITNNVEKLKDNLKINERLEIEANEKQSRVDNYYQTVLKQTTSIELRIKGLVESIELPERFSDVLLKIKELSRNKLLNDAEEALKSVFKKIAEDIANLLVQKKILNLDFDNKLSELKESLTLLENKVLGLKTHKEELNRSLEQKKIALDSSVVTDFDRLNIKKIGDIEKEINESKGITLKFKDELDRINLIIERNIRDEQQAQIITSGYLEIVNKTKATWENANLKGSPDAIQLSIEMDRIKEQLDNIYKVKELLDNIQIEVTRRNENTNFKNLQKNIDDIKGQIEENIFLDQLVTKRHKLEGKFNVLEQKINTLDSFSNNLASELKTVDSRIKEIEPIWRSLLSRIVLDPRYSKTELDIKTKYKKPVATISAPLHNGVTPVSALASEAQITDLQLTFLMAMAQKQNWSPWRALLLDDPTQHHDLVHSSSVFDLLRDFIVEGGFQLILTTHDKVQANFLRRKLENDGVAVTMCHLIATDEGVTSKELMI
ncbi:MULTISPECIES: AAA family ATPase [unclassified Pseudoalteromonas]|uniref:AAA family ATPase n=1 Tax=unclassified Pseudoalteromonas TaxID=194690 RepID=UPI0013FD58B1|nr:MULTISPECIES: AAA family ATPase [unclassified Pseudoalteromonas]